MTAREWGVIGLLALGAPATADVIVPPEGIELTQIHIPFHWTAIDDVDEYQLQVAIDSGGPAPFEKGDPVVDIIVVGDLPAAKVTSGLTFDESYVWRVRAHDPEPLEWSETRRFSIAPPPVLAPTFGVTQGQGTYEPGYTLFSGAFGLAVVIDQSGNPIWYRQFTGIVHDIRLLPSGRLLVLDNGRAYIMTTTGRICWQSPEEQELRCHHEASPMPNGNVLTILYETRGPLDWLGDVFVEFDRNTNEIVWSWSVWDYFSTEDFDPEEDTDWTHANAVVYNPDDDSVYISCRHLNRITRIDYQTGDILYNMGFDLPSGDVDFGDNLFSFQHAPQLLPNGNMVVYDNGNRRDHMVQTPETGVSKAIELAFDYDPETGIPVDTSIVWEWEVPEYTPFVCDADRLPGGNTLVCTGPANATHEVAPDGSVVWEMNHDGFGLVLRTERISALVLDVSPDSDGDGVADMIDNCPDWANPDQEDCDGDGFGDVCAIALGFEPDADGDDVPDACDEPSDCGADVNSSGIIDVEDMIFVLLDWGCSGDCFGDANSNGVVDVLDLVEVILTWGPCS